MSPAIDFSQVQDLKPVPPGTYLASITTAKSGMSQAQNPKLDITWKIEEGEFEGRNVFDTLTFSPKSLYRVKGTLIALDFPADFSGEVVPDELVGKTALIVVDIDNNDSGQVDEAGEPYPPRNRVKKVKSASSPTGKPNLSKLLN
jgi:hypothetical protein